MAFPDQLFRIELERGLVGADARIHQRLGEAWLIAFVMAEAAIAEHVDHHRPPEALAELDRDLGGEHHGFRIVAVHMQHRRLDHLGDVGRVRRRARIHRARGEADLVVDDEMHRTAGAVPLEAREPQAFGDHALAGKRGIAMQQQRQHHGAVGPAPRPRLIILPSGAICWSCLARALPSTTGSTISRWLGLAVSDRCTLVAVELAVRGGTQMVLDVARAFHVLGVERATLELVEQRAVRLAHHLGQDVEAPTMRHAQHDVLDPQGAAALDDLLQRRDQRFRAIQAKPLGAGELDVEELLEALGLDQLVEDRLLALGREGDFLVRAFDAFLDPLLGFGIGDMHELDADGAAIGARQDRQHLGDGGVFEPEIVIDEDLAGEIGFGEAIAARIEFRRRLVGLELERVEIGMQMPAHAIGTDHHDGADRIARRLQHIGCGRGGSARRLRPSWRRPFRS